MNRIIALALTVLFAIGNNVGYSQPANQVASAVGLEKGWVFVQHYRQKYDAYKSHAAAALMKGDLGNASNSLTQAYQNLPDGYSIKFTPDVNGVRADLMEGDKLIQFKNFTPQQLGLFLRSPQSMFDHVLSKGSVNLFGQLDKAHLVQTKTPMTQPAAMQAQKQAQSVQPFDAEAAIEARSRKIFPWASQEEQRQLWIADRLSEQLDRQRGNSLSISVRARQ